MIHCNWFLLLWLICKLLVARTMWWWWYPSYYRVMLKASNNAAKLFSCKSSVSMSNPLNVPVYTPFHFSNIPIWLYFSASRSSLECLNIVNHLNNSLPIMNFEIKHDLILDESCGIQILITLIYNTLWYLYACWRNWSQIK